MVVMETLRLHSPINIISRGCTKDYVVPGTSVKIEKGQEVHVPHKGIHMDERYYPQPEKFEPENFAKEAK